MELLYLVGWVQQVSLPGTRGAATHIHAADGSATAYYDCAAGSVEEIGMVADLNTLNIGDAILRFHHCGKKKKPAQPRREGFANTS